jgi:hypothetical protein
MDFLWSENQRKATLQYPRHYGTDHKDLEGWLEFQVQRFLMLGFNPDINNAVIWVASQLGGHPLNWWLNAKT